MAVMAPPSSFPPADASRWAEAPPVLPLRFSSPQIAIIYGRRDNLLMRAAFCPSVLPRWRRRRRLRRRRRRRRLDARMLLAHHLPVFFSVGLLYRKRRKRPLQIPRLND